MDTLLAGDVRGNGERPQARRPGREPVERLRTRQVASGTLRDGHFARPAHRIRVIEVLLGLHGIGLGAR